MEIYVSQLSIHLDTKIWGTDATEFKPSRWIDADSGQIITPPKGSFIPWSGGPRICPGLKMSQVEFVATMATLFRSAHCEALPTAGIEDPEALRQRLLQLMGDTVSKLTLQMRNPGGVQLRWVVD
jgi:cytochrome P450